MEKTYKMLGIITALAALVWFSTSCHSPVDANALNGTVNIEGDPWVNATLTVDTNALGGSGTIYYHWRYSGNSTVISTDSVYFLQNADRGRRITVTVIRFDNPGSVTSNPTDPIILPPLTGTVTVDGTFWADSTLSADIDDLGGSGAVSYQWTRNENTINGATNSTYTLQDNDVGSTINVNVTRNDNSGSITGNPTPTVSFAPISGSVSIAGIAEVGQMLTVNTDDLGGSGAISYQWNRVAPDESAADIANIIGNTNTYTVQTDDIGHTITVTVTRARNTGSITSNPTDIVPLGGQLPITGTIRVGEILRINTDVLGSGGSGEFFFQWRRIAPNGNYSDIPNATGNTYTVQFADISSNIVVVVTRDDISGSITSDPTTAVPEPVVTIPGATPHLVGQTLTTNITNIGSNVTISYQWRRNATPISGATESAYTVQFADVGAPITVTISDGTGNPATSATIMDAIVLAPVTITGTAKVGETLTANTANLIGSGISYQWMQGGVAIPDAENSTYIVQFADAEARITVRVSRTGLSGNYTSTRVTVPKPVTITGTVLAGEILTANTDDLSGNGISYQWLRYGYPILDSIGSTYTVQFYDVGAEISVTVNCIGLDGDYTSTPTVAVPTPVRIIGDLYMGETLTANTDSLGGSSGTISYQWMRRIGSGNFTSIEEDATGSTYVLQPADVGANIRVEISRAGLGYFISEPTDIISDITIDDIGTE